MDIQTILKQAVIDKASDVFIVAGLPISIRKNGEVLQDENSKLLPEDTESLVLEIYRIAGRSLDHLNQIGDDDFSFALRGVSRFRVSAYKQRGSYSAVIRIITFDLPNPADFGIPEQIIELGNRKKGVVLITGAAGSGKSTTLACIIDRINQSRRSHIITLEDPLEFLHKHNKSIVSQREINIDADTYVSALRAALRQSPDIILLGEMRDRETIEVAMTAAETGHLLFSTLHTIGAANTIDRIIDAFPANQQRQIAIQLSMVLSAVVSQQLVPGIDGELIPAFEIMVVNPAIRNIIRENKTPQLEGILYSSNSEGLISMDTSLFKLYLEGRITAETALAYATNPEMMKKKLGQ